MSFGNRPLPYAQPIGLQDQQVSQNVMGTPLCHVAGTEIIAAQWFSPIYNLKSYQTGGGKKGNQKGKGQQGPSTYNYFGTVAGTMGSGPLDGIRGIIMDGESVWPQALAWSVSQTLNPGDTRTYDAQVYVALVSMTSSAANAPGAVDPDTNWTAHLFAAAGYVATAPTWTVGVTYNIDALVNYGGATTYQCLVKNVAASGNLPAITNSPDNKTYWEKITGVMLGLPAWTPGAAYIVGDKVLFNGALYLCVTANTATSGNHFWALYGATGSAYDDITVLIPNTGSTAKKNSLGAPTVYGIARLYWGTQTARDPYLSSFGDTHPAYVGLPYVILGVGSVSGVGGWFLGQGNNTAPNIQFIVQRTPKQTVVTGLPASLVDGNANLAAMAVELLTDDNTLDLPVSLVDPTSFNAAAAILQAYETAGNLSGASCVVDSQQNIASILQIITDMCDGYFRFNPGTGCIEFGIYQHGVIPGSYATLNQNQLTERPELEGEGWSKVMSRCTIQFNDRTLTWGQNTYPADDPRAWTVLQQVRNSNIDRPWVTRMQQAMQLALETLRTIGTPQLTAEITVRREFGRSIRPGDYILLDIDLEPNSLTIAAYFRVKSREIPMTGPIKFKLLKDNTLTPVHYVAAPPATLQDTQSLAPIVNARILLDDFDITEEDPGEAALALIERPDTITLATQVYFDVNDQTGAFPSIGVQTAFAAYGLVASAVAITDTTISVTLNPSAPDQSLYGVESDAVSAMNDELLLILCDYPTYGITPTCTMNGVGTYNATLTPVIANGIIASITITAAGSGMTNGVYTNYGPGGTPNVVISGDLAFSAAYVLVTVAGGAVVSVTVQGPPQVLPDAIGRATVEVCSVSSMTLTAGSTFTFSVLRGRRNTQARAWLTFGTAAEAWLIYRSDLAALVSAQFPALRNDAFNSGGPIAAFFRLAPCTKTLQLEVSDILSRGLIIPIKAPEGPDVRFTTGSNGSLTVAHGSFVCEIVFTQRDLPIGVVNVWLVPGGSVFLDTIPPTFSFDIVTNTSTPSGYSPSGGSATPAGFAKVYLELNQAGSGAFSGGFLKSAPLSIGTAGTYRLIAAAVDINGLASSPDQFQELTIVAT
jgi:hypothetical protein